MNTNTMFGRMHQRIRRDVGGGGQLPGNIRRDMGGGGQFQGLMRFRYNTTILAPATAPATAQHPIPENRRQGDIKIVNERGVKSSATMTWGKPTWYFFHTLAEKIKPEEFSKIRVDLLDIIYSISVNLPCPDCANHARIYLDNINFNTIQTKDDLKYMLFIFHNSVNQRKGYPMFTIQELNELYKAANTTNIVNYFFTTYLTKNNSPRMMANELFRRRIIHKAQEWLILHYDKFLHPG